MRFAYADPPYIGRSSYYKDHPDYAGEVDHQQLIDQLISEYPDGWALSCSSSSLPILLPMCTIKVRVGAWVKPLASFKKGVNPAYAWEPVIFHGGRKRDPADPTHRDWVSENITMKKGLPGAKPYAFCVWLFNLLNIRRGDVFDDLFPGTGKVTEYLSVYLGNQGEQMDFFGEAEVK